MLFPSHKFQSHILQTVSIVRIILILLYSKTIRNSEKTIHCILKICTMYPNCISHLSYLYPLTMPVLWWLKRLEALIYGVTLRKKLAEFRALNYTQNYLSYKFVNFTSIALPQITRHAANGKDFCQVEYGAVVGL